MGCFSDSFLRFDVAHSPQPDIFTCETPPYSSDIYADYFPGNDYDVDPNDIDTAFDCDISTLDSYLHSPSSTPTQQSSIASIEQPAAFDKCAVEEFFPNLCQSSNASLVQQTSRRSSRSSGDSLSPDASSDYREKRDKNNIASKRSRQKRAEKQREMRNEKEILERRNIELRTLLGSLEVQVADYKHIVLMMMSKLRS
uniref:BZIP domain-containing protein n=1 Tax=Angiostrongylus cantonensis TaxID=6313 RepID=A0A0K0CXF2_ANGCA